MRRPLPASGTPAEANIGPAGEITALAVGYGHLVPRDTVRVERRVDGQQRLTSLTLLLIFLRRLQEGREDVVDIDQLIFSETFGEKSFNLDSDDPDLGRVNCMEALFERGSYEPPADASESVHTLVRRYDELHDLFPDELRGKSLPFFIDWLKDRVQFVQITAYADDDVYAIFETMNDRGPNQVADYAAFCGCQVPPPDGISGPSRA